MSLVDYASSDEDEDENENEENLRKQNTDNLPLPNNNQPPPPLPPNQRSGQTESSNLKLPDASLLLNSPISSGVNGYDHSSRVAAAMAQNASRKRDSNGSVSTCPRSKVPRGSLPPSRSTPETAGGLLRPPQLSGRSNVVTEDISKLFVRRQVDPSSD